jgi:hypothetical protein
MGMEKVAEMKKQTLRIERKYPYSSLDPSKSVEQAQKAFRREISTSYTAWPTCPHHYPYGLPLYEKVEVKSYLPTVEEYVIRLECDECQKSPTITYKHKWG